MTQENPTPRPGDAQPAAAASDVPESPAYGAAGADHAAPPSPAYGSGAAEPAESPARGANAEPPRAREHAPAGATPPDTALTSPTQPDHAPTNPDPTPAEPKKGIRRYSAKIIAGVVVIAGLAVGTAIDNALPSTADVLDAPFERHAAVGEMLELRTLDVTVLDVQTAEQVIDYGSVYETTGVWLVLQLEVTVRDRPVAASGLRLVTQSGNIYGGFADVNNACTVMQPGITSLCQTAFEVHPDDLVGAQLQLPANGTTFDTSDDVGVIDLGIAELPAAVPSIELTRIAYGGDE